MRSGDAVCVGQRVDSSVAVPGRVAVYDEPAAVEVQDPVLGDACGGVDRRLAAEVDRARRDADLDDEQRLRGVGVPAAGGHDREIGLRQADLAEDVQRALRADVEPGGGRDGDESHRKPADRVRVRLALRAHLDEHPVEQLDVVVLPEDAGVDHRSEIVDRERVYRQRNVDVDGHADDRTPPGPARERVTRPLTGRPRVSCRLPSMQRGA